MVVVAAEDGAAEVEKALSRRRREEPVRIGDVIEARRRARRDAREAEAVNVVTRPACAPRFSSPAAAPTWTR